MSQKLIGILAGMGPRSTAPFINLVIDECQLQYGAKYDEEFPKMMIYSLPTPFYIDRPINHELMKKTVIEGLQKLQSIGVSFIAMPCNSAHIYYKELQESINIPLLNIIDETIKELPIVSQKVTLFSTSSTFQSEVYQKGITNGSHEFIFKDGWQTELNNLIQSIKIDKESNENIGIWNKLIEDVKKESIENIVIACTDLNIVLEKANPSIDVIDSSKCLAKSVVSKYLELG
ncbi:aspartate racemase [Anaerovirgula multivorans]|uniref:Aspartate racemase n=1 Tax=Anaerovirgula multivorans TaxID=312168 RepID=A0A239I8S4_9FIRM|nr:amino acid racemase [Anaerovirgula multivorans]SNS90000.1 aspartate racemase [Anaerovirgula multivorans]